MNLIRLAALVVASSLAACAGGTPPADAPPAGPGHEHGHEHAHEHGGGEHAAHEKLAGAPRAFHEILAPVWHAPKGPDRDRDACAAAPTLEARAADVLKERPEGSDAPARAAAQALAKACAELTAECAKPAGQRAVEPRLASVHEAFHTIARHR